MSSLNFTFRNVSLFIVVFMYSHFALANVLTVPESTVNSFYNAYLNEDSTNEQALIRKYVSSELIKSINDSTMCNYDSDDSVSATELEKKCSQKRECKQYKGNYICDWYGVWVESDVNYFTKSQEIYPSWKSNIKTNIISQKDKESLIGVILGDGKDITNKLRVTLKKENNGWKIISVTE